MDDNKAKVFKFIRIFGVIVFMIGAVLLAWAETETMTILGIVLMFVGVSDVAIGTFLLKRQAG